MDVKQSKPSLEIEPALVDGFLVREVYDGTGDSPGVLFAGTLSHCLAFMESRMRPQQAIYTPDPADVVRVGDLTREEIEQGYADAKRAPTQDPGIVRATPVDLRDISAPGVVDREWDGGAAAAFRGIGKAWREKQEQVPFKYPPKSNDDPRLSSIVRMLEDKGRASMAAYLSWVEVQVILAALRQQDAQNAGRIEKDIK
jgi:hypothetical protein